MPHLSTFNLNPGSWVEPIVGNRNIGGACYDGNGQALYIVNVGGNFEVWRTRAGWASLMLTNGSVDYLSTVRAGSFIEDVSAASLQRIGGILYATVGGKNPGNYKAGQYLYRDTSTDKNGAGPWVLHGTVYENTYAAASSGNLAGGRAGGEILVSGTRWAQNVAYIYDVGSSSTWNNYRVFISDDGGATWAQAMSNDDIYAGRWSRNFSQPPGGGGAWYTSGESAVWKSTDLLSWTNVGNFGMTGLPVSTAALSYRVDGMGNMTSAPAPPEANPVYSGILATLPGGTMPVITNIHSDARPVWTAVDKGYVMRLTVAATKAPPCRLYPREDGLGTSSATRQFPRPRGQQSGYRQTDYY